MASNAVAWEQHQSIMEAILQNPENTEGRAYLKQKIKLPSSEQELKTIQQLATEIKINGDKVPHFFKNESFISIQDLFLSSMIDEPDLGMDQDLPESDDPLHERKWMGGSTGPTSQGFRHMFFPGIEWGSPVQTFQLPFHAIGQAEERIHTLLARSNQFFSEGDLFWGYRTLFWMLHYVQDLHQPFHVTQVPYYQMLPLKKLFSGFVAASTQVMSNYHYAYEGLVLEFVKTAPVDDFGQCFVVKNPRPVDNVGDLVRQTRSSAPGVGRTMYAIFGNEMKDPDMDLPNDKGSIDYYSYVHANLEIIPELEVAALKVLKEITCGLMKGVSSYTLGELDRAHSLSENSRSTGK